MWVFLGWFSFDKKLLVDSFNVTGQPVRSVFSESLTITLWSFIGLESACNLAGHARNPKRDVPFATFFGTLLAAILYILSTTAMMGVVPNEVLQTSAAPFSVAARYILGDWAGELVSAMAIVACFGSLNGWILMHGQVCKIGLCGWSATEGIRQAQSAWFSQLRIVDHRDSDVGSSAADRRANGSEAF